MDEDIVFEEEVVEQEQDYINPGPINPELLYEQDVHVSTRIWNGQERANLETIGSNIGLKEWHLNKSQEDRVKAIGFGVALDSANFVRGDSGLMGALFERWRPETNTFHFPTGEATITLQDVGFILGLPMGGIPIVDRPRTGAKEDPFKPLIKLDNLGKDDLKTDGLRLTYMRTNYGKPLPEEHSQEEEDLQVKLFLLDVISSILFPSSGKSYAHGRYVSFVMNLDEVNTYCWSSGVLAHTYKALSRASYDAESFFNGCSSLVMHWIFLRVPLVSPVAREDSKLWLPRARAYAYSTKKPYKRYPKGKIGNTVIFFRGEIDSLAWNGSFVWDPYADFLNSEHAELALRYRKMGLKKVALIHFVKIAYQMPDRVVRQFGLNLEIPANPNRNDWERLRVQQANLFESLNAFELFEDLITAWRDNVFQGDGANFQNNPAEEKTLDEYMRWYSGITRRWIQRPPPLDNPPRTEYFPRSIIPPKFPKVTDKAVATMKKTFKHAPPELKGEIKEVNKQYEEEVKAWRDPNFSSILEEEAGDDLVTPAMPPRREGGSEKKTSVPPCPVKDKGKRKAFETSDDKPSFDLGLNLTPLKHPKPSESGGGGGGELEDEVILLPHVRSWVNENWFHVSADEGSRTVRIGDLDMSINHLKSLAIGEEVYDDVIVAYTRLLVEREVALENAGHQRKKRYWVTSTDFMRVCKIEYRSTDVANWVKSRRKNKGKVRVDEGVLRYLRGEIHNQPPITTREAALIPILHENPNHYTLFEVSLDSQFTISVFDSYYDEDEIKRLFSVELDIMFNYVAEVLRQHFKMKIEKPMSKRTRPVIVRRSPQQINFVDCGVFVMKSMDILLQGRPLPDDYTQIGVARYNIAWQLKQGKASGYAI